MSKVCHRKWNVYSGTGPTPSLSTNFPTQIHQVHTFPHLNFTSNSENLTKFTLFTRKTLPKCTQLRPRKWKKSNFSRPPRRETTIFQSRLLLCLCACVKNGKSQCCWFSTVVCSTLFTVNGCQLSKSLGNNKRGDNR